ncbi:MAG TPA: DEAD/DEAH box helicase family protein, partial [Candidatus Acutalibacter pullicola]|nr:DEAD/DEAH box helicase family protein [Candidatus Acutalibacter pullicola]
GSDYWDAVKLIEPQLDDPARVEEIYQMMVPILEATPQDDRRYDLRRQAFENLTAFRQGTFTLFAEHKEPAAPAIPQAKAYDLGYGHMGNGLTVWNRLEEEHGDYKTVAHIAPDRTVTIYDEEMPQAVREEIKRIADTSEMTISATQDAPVFTVPPRVQEPPQREEAAEGNYQLLSRLKADCDYFLGAGGRAEKHLWAGNVREQIAKMRELYTALPEKPEWLTLEDIDRYAQRMEPLYEVVVYHHFENGFDERLDYQTLAEAEQAAQKYVAGTMEGEDGFAYDGAGIFDLQENRWLRVYGNFPDERAMEQAKQAPAAEESLTGPEQASLQPKKGESLPPPPTRPRHEGITFTTLHPEIPPEQRHNFRITDDHLGEGGAKTKFHNNVAAIQTLRKIESEGRLATPEEQEILSRYVGWGGLPQAFDGNNPQWAEEFTQLQKLLSPKEYEAAKATTLNAYYTSPAVIKAIYQAVENMGFRTGNILEPSCGIGNFFGLVPESMSESNLYGVELDTLTGRIAQQLYQQSSIAVQGFEETELPDSFFDLAIGNVPFGSYSLHDKRYDKHHFLIHDYFFAKTLDKVRPGGIVAFISSKGTLDKQNPSVRKYIAERAELIGAIRLPNNAFLTNAGTQVTTDILFLQKREKLVDVSMPEPNAGLEWLHLGQTEDGVPVNQYFLDHPEMLLGKMAFDRSMYGNEKETTCKPLEDADLSDLLAKAVKNLHAQYAPYEIEEREEEEEDRSIPADPTVKNFSYTIADGQVYYRENSRMFPVEVSVTAENRIRGMIALRDCARNLIEVQMENGSEEAVQAGQRELNRLYDSFTAQYGLLNSRANTSVFSADSSFPLLCSLEVLDEQGSLKRKADMFIKRTIQPYRVVTHVDTASEALAVSLGEKARVDLEYMGSLTGKTQEQLAEELRGVIFPVPGEVETNGKPHYVTADEYLSGNVREKLRQARAAAEASPTYTTNVEALEKVQPKDLTAGEISVRLGAAWIPEDVAEQFTHELLQTPFYYKSRIRVRYSPVTGEWNVSEKSLDQSSIRVFSTYGTKRVNAYKLIEDTLNLRDVRVFDTVQDENGKDQRVLNKKETAIAQDKQDQIKEKFQEWVWADPTRRERLCTLYNERFNAIRPREYDGSHLVFAGMNPEITLRPHQRNAVARAIYGGNALFAHVVGAGKTYEMIAAAMESKRLGLSSKALFVVPNHIIGDFASDFLDLYPGANILVATKKDFEKQRRKKFCARIATGDYDGIILGHSQFEKIPLSTERQQAMLKRQIAEVVAGIQAAKKQEGSRFTVKQMEKSKKSLEAKLKKLHDQSTKDDVVTFEELGVDRLFIDEADLFKNLYLYTKMRNVGGISQTESLKASDLYMKCQYMDEFTGGKGVVFATGTPVSNSMAELYTMQRYLQGNLLKELGLSHFDAWASQFGETVTSMELKPEGQGFQQKTRFSNFYNLPELMALFKEVADIQTADMLNLPVPKARYETVVCKPSDIQKEMVEALGQRADAVRSGAVDASQDNMLLITNDGRKLALDQRLLNPLLPDVEGSKVNVCAEKVYQIWKDTQKDRLTQLVFCDLSTPKTDGNFSVYNDLKDKLVARGIPQEEIAFVHSAANEAQKQQLFGKVRAGQVRVLMGSTAKMGAGTNVQDKLIALHDLDCPWRPRDLEQRSGRIIRQGNQNPEVQIYRYVTEGTFDSYLYQMVENKQRFISQVFTSKAPARVMQEIDDVVLSYNEIKALATGNPQIIERANLETEVNKLKMLRASFLSQRYELEDKVLKYYPQQIQQYEERIAGTTADIARRDKNTPAEGFPPMNVKGIAYTEKAQAGKALLEACSQMESVGLVSIGSYRGFGMVLAYEAFSREYQVSLKGALTHRVPLGTDVFGNITRLDNALNGLEQRLESNREALERTKEQMVVAQAESEKPFPREQELREKSQRLAELTKLLKLDEKDRELLDSVPDEGEEAPARKVVGRER